MRYSRLGALVAWLAMASFAIAGFAAFSPARVDAPITEPAAVQATALAPTTEAASSVGLAAGRVAAMNFATSATSAGLDAQSTLGQIGADDARAFGDRLAAGATTSTQAPTTTAAPTTTEVPPTTNAPATTEAPTTTEPPATTAPPTTEAPPATDPPVDAIYVPPGTEPWLGLIQASFASGDVERALMVVFCESNGNAGATNPSSGAAGLFQHLPIFWAERSTAAGWAGADIYDPAANVAVAAWLVYEGGGWSHWNPSAGCWG